MRGALFNETIADAGVHIVNAIRATAPSRRCSFSVLSLLALIPASSDASDRHWRVFQQADGAILAASNSDDATDNLGSPFFRCQNHSGTVVVEGKAPQVLRNAVADLIRSNEYPQVALIPASSVVPALLTVSYSEMDGAWGYSFSLGATEPAFDVFRNSGLLTFKVGTAEVREEYKVGLENVAKFQAICKRSK